MKTEQALETEISPQVDAEANEWFLRIRAGGLSEQELSAWRLWLEKDPVCENAFNQVEALWRDLDDVSEIPFPDDRALQADLYDGEESVSHWLQSSRGEVAASGSSPDRSLSKRFSRVLSPLFRPASLWAMAGTASMAVAVLVFVVMSDAPAPTLKLESYQTAHAEHRQITLRDGSEIELGAETILTVSFSDGARDVNLVRGEAYFLITPDKSRPFTVQMGGAFVQVVGTEFNIDRDGLGSTVTVVEGHVRVADERKYLDGFRISKAAASQDFVELLAGDQVVVDNSGALGGVNKVDADSAVAWREGLLVFINESMEDVVSELNRYSERRIILANTSVGSIEFTGTVDKTRINEWLTSLGKAYPINVSVIDEKTVLLFSKKK